MVLTLEVEELTWLTGLHHVTEEANILLVYCVFKISSHRCRQFIIALQWCRVITLVDFVVKRPVTLDVVELVVVSFRVKFHLLHTLANA